MKVETDFDGIGSLRLLYRGERSVVLINFRAWHEQLKRWSWKEQLQVDVQDSEFCYRIKDSIEALKSATDQQLQEFAKEFPTDIITWCFLFVYCMCISVCDILVFVCVFLNFLSMNFRNICVCIAL